MPDPVPADELRWTCPRAFLDFSTTAELEPARGVVGQEAAAEALRFGITIDAHGQNVYVRGWTGTGRLTLVRDTLRTHSPQSPEPLDRVYVHDFARPDQPRLLSMPQGEGPKLKARADELVRFIVEDLSDLLNTDSLRVRTHEIEAAIGREVEEVSAPFEASLAEAGLALVGIEGEDGPEPAILPVIDGEPLTFDDLREKADPRAVAALEAKAEALSVQLERVSVQVARLRTKAQRATRRLVEGEARKVLGDSVADIRRTWPVARIWLDEVVADVVSRLGDLEEDAGFVERYRVHVLVTRTPGAPRPVVIENVPNVQTLLGGVDLPAEGLAVAPHLGLHAGALVQADGGTLVLMARDLFTEPGAWAALKRTLRTGLLELTPQEMSTTTLRQQHLKPEAIPVRVKVVLIGEPDVWMAIDEVDPDFQHLFKVLVDLDDVVPRDGGSVDLYGQVVARMCRDEGLPAFTSSAVGALVEHGARVASEAGKLTARFGRIADIAREAAFAARVRGVGQVHRQDVDKAIFEGKRRADLPGRRFRERMSTGIIKVHTRGDVVGQVNGLAVVQSGPLTYGFPLRITATVGAGTEGTVHVEREAMLSGQIHTKGFLILQGLLRYLLHAKHPLVFDASITHEQSYGGVDGDSASGAEFVCLMSAITEVPVRQGLAMTGAIDQHGNVLAVGAVDEKIEGFFDACAVRGLDGTQGVLVPASTVGDLQLRRDVVEACRAGRFAVWPVERIEEAMELLLGRPAEELVAMARERAEVLWLAANEGD